MPLITIGNEAVGRLGSNVLLKKAINLFNPYIALLAAQPCTAFDLAASLI